MNTYQEWEDSLDRDYIEQLDPSAFELAPCAFEAGAQSKQSEIDELRKQINEVLDYIGTDFDDYYTGGICETIYEIIKGKTNEQ